MLTEAVFPFYLIHQTIIVLVMYALLPAGLPGWAEFALLLAATTIGCIAFYWIGRSIAPLRPLIGLRALPSKETQHDLDPRHPRRRRQTRQRDGLARAGCGRARRPVTRALDAGAAECWRTAAARSMRSRRRCACWRTIRTSTPGAARSSRMTARSSSTPRSWTGAPARPGRSPASPRRATRSASPARSWSDSPHVFLAGEGADAFSREQDLEQADADWFAHPERRRQFAEFKADGRRVRRRPEVRHGRRGRVRQRTAMSPPPPRPAASPASAGAGSAIRR